MLRDIKSGGVFSLHIPYQMVENLYTLGTLPSTEIEVFEKGTAKNIKLKTLTYIKDHILKISQLTYDISLVPNEVLILIIFQHCRRHPKQTIPSPKILNRLKIIEFIICGVYPTPILFGKKKSGDDRAW